MRNPRLAFIRTIRRALALAALLVAGLPLAAAAQGARLALVVGNEAYAYVPGLETPVRDAQGVATALRDMGFDVTVLTDVGPEVFEAVLGTFANKAETAETVLFYYSGHAFQMGGVNHLVPVSARLDDAARLGDETWKLDEIAARLRPKDGQLLIFLDACRTNPLPDATQAQAAVGLAQYDGGAGSFVAFATAPGAAAWDKGADGTNSPFTGALLKHISEPGQTLSDLMISVRNDVSDATGGKQTPWEQSSLRSQFYFRPATNLQPGTEAVVSTGADLPQFDTVEAESFLVDETEIAEAGAAIQSVDGKGTIRLAALSSDTRSLSAVEGNTKPRIAGVDAMPSGVEIPADLATGVQEQLKRVGCYSMRVDGQWGDGSRRALQRYYTAAKIESDEVEPTAEVYLALTKAKEETCKPEPVAVKPKPSGGTKKSAPAQKAPTQKAAPAPAPAPAKKEPKCKFMVVAIVCS